ncbi:trafficking kinesin-binding protein 1 isoform X1 [Megalops cyprinoides]|uniref:trafficking kinesin-binding protein 1 isoform X1 n=2 Tax=Megalops cyprinoides TaxID=118141 RepID=UPI0018655D2A|nr:trafficking kinesin-binding protein 1 isoform X1 [Megalops cyprinoides]
MEVWSTSIANDKEKECNGNLVDVEDNADALCRELVEVMCSERVGQVTKTYHDIEAVTHLLEEKERDLELAARIGQSLLKQNRALTEHNELLDEQLEIAKEEIAQLRHELSMREDLLHLYASTEEIEPASTTSPASDISSPIRRNESSSSLSYVHYDFLEQKLKGLEEENLKLRSEASELTSETTSYEEQEQQLMMDCVEELSSANKQVVALSDELARKVEDTLRQQEEISCLLAQIVDLQHRSKTLSMENEELTQHLTASRESQAQLRSELRDLRDKYSECEDMLQEAREELKNLRNKSLPNSTVSRYSALAAVFPMDSLAAEIEGTMRKGLDSPAPPEYKNHPWRVFETVKAVNQAARRRSRCDSPQVPGSNPSSARSSHTSTPRTSYYGSDSASVTLEDKPSAGPCLPDDQSGVEEKRLGQPGTPGGQDLEAALRRLSARQESHASERPFFEVERERKLRALAAQGDGSSGFLTPNDSILSIGTNYSSSSQHSSGSGLSSGSRPYLPDRLQIVKPLEGSVTLLHWQQLAKPNLGGILHPRPGVLTKDFRELEVDLQHVYSLNDLEEDEPDFSLFSTGLATATHGDMGKVTPSSHNLPQTPPTHTITTCRILHPSLQVASLSHSLCPRSLSTCRGPEYLRHMPPHLHSGSSGDLHDHTHTTSSACLGLLKLLQEQGISASTHAHPAFPPWSSLSRTHAASRPGSSIPPAMEGGQCQDSKRQTNIFSLNLVGKLQSLGLDKVVARGIISPKGERKEC